MQIGSVGVVVWHSPRTEEKVLMESVAVGNGSAHSFQGAQLWTTFSNVGPSLDTHLSSCIQFLSFAMLIQLFFHGSMTHWMALFVALQACCTVRQTWGVEEHDCRGFLKYLKERLIKWETYFTSSSSIHTCHPSLLLPSKYIPWTSTFLLSLRYFSLIQVSELTSHI